MEFPSISVDEVSGSKKNGLIVAIDASRNRSGGARAHLIGILGADDPRRHGIQQIHVWSYEDLLNALPDTLWLVKHKPPALAGSLLKQVWWQRTKLQNEIKANGCDVLLTTDAGSVCRFKPSVVMSRDMLSFEGNEIERYPLWTFARLRLILLRYMQVNSLRHGSGALFLTNYASNVIQKYTGPLSTVRVVPHGIGDQFRQETSY